MNYAPRISLILLLLAAIFVRIPAAASNPTEPVRLAHIGVHPARIELTSRFDTRQLLLTGYRVDGQVVDLTREAELIDPPPALEVTERRRVLPLEDGQGTLRFRVRGQDLEIPYRVEGLSAATRPSFSQDIQPVLSRLGCNAGSCHGSANGKNGFKLSLRGYDHEYDFTALTDDLAGRRFNRAAPDRSLFLMKPSGGVPHEGGVLMATDSREYAQIRSWVQQGAEFDGSPPQLTGLTLLPENPIIPEPGLSQQFKVLARYDDGTERDVSSLAFLEVNDIERLEADKDGLVSALRQGDSAVLARYEGAFASTRVFVMGDRSGFEWPAPVAHNFIDELVYERLEEIQTPPSELCNDETFLRRIHLDLTGLPPSVRQVRAFLLDGRDSRTKRDELIERLLGGVEFIDHWTNKWSDLLQVNAKFLGREGASRLREWVRGSVASNRPYDRFVSEIISARGSTRDNPPASYYKILRKPDQVMENTTQLFLGVRFNCNKCHDHPFERWTQQQHWQLAAYFSRVQREDAPGSPKMNRSSVMAADEAPPAFDEIISELDAGELVHPDNGRTYLPGLPFEHDGAIPQDASRRDQLSAWLTAPENPYFAKSFVNRLWSYFLGVGIIDPVDDIRAGNPPTNPKLLARLTEEFVSNGFDVRQMMRLICRSRVYQHSIETLPLNQDDQLNFSHALARRLPAETLYDAVHLATGSRSRLPGQRPGRRAAGALDPAMKLKDGFLDLFGRPSRESACECERGSGLSLGQTLNLVNGPTIAEAINDPDNDLFHLVRLASSPAEIVDELYLAFLGRFPAADERDELSLSLDPLRRENLAALDTDHLADLETKRAEWEQGVSITDWEPLEIAGLRSRAGGELTVAEDGSIRAGGKAPDKDTYTILARTDLTGITGIRLEALPDETLPAQGPGRAENGNFVLNRLRLSALGLRDPDQPRDVPLAAASADFSQDGWPVAESISENDTKGWAVSTRFGQKHEAVIELGEDVGAEGGTLLIFNLTQNFGTGHVLGRFRLSVTRDTRPVRHHGLPEAVFTALSAKARTAEQQDVLHRYFMNVHPELAATLRLHTTQDLAWALANSPEFLFNH